MEEGLKNSKRNGKRHEWSELQILLSKSEPETRITDPNNT